MGSNQDVDIESWAVGQVYMPPKNDATAYIKFPNNYKVKIGDSVYNSRVSWSNVMVFYSESDKKLCINHGDGYSGSTNK